MVLASCIVDTHLVWSVLVFPVHMSRTAFAVMPNLVTTFAAVSHDLSPSFAR